ncbi:MAG: DUF2232 domain-containing protein [Alphaproteobacteria bacterium]|nr:DUF2232 domain-containing protein [Alphaproteobacteria bacterium]
MNSSQKSRTAVAAGIGLAFLYAYFLTGYPFPFFSFYLGSLLVYVVGMTRGFVVASGAVLTAGVLLFLFFRNLGSVILILLPFGFTGIWFVYLSSLSRLSSGPSSALCWYPVERLLFWMASFACLGVLFVIFMFNIDEQVIQEGIRLMIVELREIFPDSQKLFGSPSEEDFFFSGLVKRIAYLTPSFAVFWWMLIHISCLYLAGRISCILKLQRRPFPDLNMISVPENAIFAMGAGLLFVLMGSHFTSSLALAITTGFAFVHLLSGLSVVHFFTRGVSFRSQLLFFFYLLLFFQFWLSFLLVFLAIFDVLFDLRDKSGNKRGGKPPTTSGGI